MRAELEEYKKYKKTVQKQLKKLLEYAGEIPVKTVEKEIEKIVEKTVEKPTEFERKICDYYGLETEEQKEEYLRIMMNPTNRNYWERNRTIKKDGVSHTVDRDGQITLWK